MNTTTVTLLLGMLIIGSVTFLLSRRSGRAKFAIGSIFTAEVEVTERDVQAAGQALARASAAKGKPSDADIGPAQGRRMLVKVLWVDDSPSNNVFETISLELLGVLVTTATNSEDALRFMQDLPFSLVITDVGRPEGPRAGPELIRMLRSKGDDRPIVVYTGNASAHADLVTEFPSVAVVDTPAHLVRAVFQSLAESTR
jgi:CheY-like chemotaxis protein